MRDEASKTGAVQQDPAYTTALKGLPNVSVEAKDGHSTASAPEYQPCPLAVAVARVPPLIRSHTYLHTTQIGRPLPPAVWPHLSTSFRTLETNTQEVVPQAFANHVATFHRHVDRAHRQHKALLGLGYAQPIQCLQDATRELQA